MCMGWERQQLRRELRSTIAPNARHLVYGRARANDVYTATPFPQATSTYIFVFGRDRTNYELWIMCSHLSGPDYENENESVSAHYSCSHVLSFDFGKNDAATSVAHILQSSSCIIVVSCDNILHHSIAERFELVDRQSGCYPAPDPNIGRLICCSLHDTRVHPFVKSGYISKLRSRAA